MPLRHAVEQRVVREALHRHQPVDRLPASFAGIQEQPSVGAAAECHHLPVERGRGAAVDRQFRQTGGVALVQRRIVQIGIAHRALQLQRPVAGQENQGGMGVDPLHRQTAMAARIAQEGDRLLLSMVLRQAGLPVGGGRCHDGMVTVSTPPRFCFHG